MQYYYKNRLSSIMKTVIWINITHTSGVAGAGSHWDAVPSRVWSSDRMWIVPPVYLHVPVCNTSNMEIHRCSSKASLVQKKKQLALHSLSAFVAYIEW